MPSHLAKPHCPLTPLTSHQSVKPQRSESVNSSSPGSAACKEIILVVRRPVFLVSKLIPRVTVLNNSLQWIHCPSFWHLYLFKSYHMPVGMRSVRLGRGAEENNIAENMVISFENDTMLRKAITYSCAWNFCCFMLKAVLEISSLSNDTLIILVDDLTVCQWMIG